jgi:hypothetical protein
VDDQCTVYVFLLDEGTHVWRAVNAESVGPGLFRLCGPVPRTESWQFQPGEVVHCEERVFSGKHVLVAVATGPPCLGTEGFDDGEA